MVKDAEKNAAEDHKRREQIDAHNRLDSMTYEVEKNAKEWSERLSPELKSKLDASVERARKALRGEDQAELRAAQEELSRTYSEAGQSLYQQQGASGTGEAGAPGSPPPGEAQEPAGAGARAGAKPGGKDDVAEADFEIVDDKK